MGEQARAAGVTEGGRDRGRDGELPVALAAVTVDGRCRERNPADQAIFGSEGERFVERFADRDAGQALLARAGTDGAAEGAAVLLTEAGERRFRISLWRQRSGERVRIVAAFAGSGPEADHAPPERTAPLPGFAIAAHDLGSPIGAVIGLAGRLRAGAGEMDAAAVAEHGADILAAAWRLRRLADDLAELGERGPGRPARHVAEVDAPSLVRRILRLAAPAACARGVEIAAPDLPARGAGPVVLGDEGALWSVLDNLVQRALALGGAGSELRVALIPPGTTRPLEITVAAAGGAGEPEREADPDGLAVARQMAAGIGARLETEGPGGSARLSIPAARCLDPA